MNERIKELAEQAKEHANHLDSIGVDASMEDIFNQKFAELIVRECAEVCYLYNAAGGADTAFVYGYKDCGDDIKRNFGVEE